MNLVLPGSSQDIIIYYSSVNQNQLQMFFPQKKTPNFPNRNVFSVLVFANNRDRKLIILVTLYCLVLVLQSQYFDVCFGSTAILYRGCCCFTFPQVSQWNLFNDQILFCITGTSLKIIIAVDLLGLFLYPSADIY